MSDGTETAAEKVERLFHELEAASHELELQRMGDVYLFRGRYKEEISDKGDRFFWGVRSGLPGDTQKREIISVWLVNVDQLTIERTGRKTKAGLKAAAV